MCGQGKGRGHLQPRGRHAEAPGGRTGEAHSVRARKGQKANIRFYGHSQFSPSEHQKVRECVCLKMKGKHWWEKNSEKFQAKV